MEIISAEWLGKPLWMWKGFLAAVLALLAFDLGVLNRRDQDMASSGASGSRPSTSASRC